MFMSPTVLVTLILSPILLVALSLWIGFSLAQQAAAETISDLKYRLADVKYEEKKAEATKAQAAAVASMQASVAKMEQTLLRMDTTLGFVAKKTHRNLLSVTDTQVGEERNETEARMGKRVRVEDLEQPTVPVEEGFTVDGRIVPPSESRDTALAFAKTT